MSNLKLLVLLAVTGACAGCGLSDGEPGSADDGASSQASHPPADTDMMPTPDPGPLTADDGGDAADSGDASDSDGNTTDRWGTGDAGGTDTSADPPDGSISAASLGAGGDTSSASVGTTEIAPSPNALVLLWVSTTLSSGTPEVPTASGAGLSFEVVHSQTRNDGPRRLTLLRAMSATPGSGPITIDLAGQVQSLVTWIVTEHGGVDTSGANGENAIAQATGDAADDFETSATVSLDAAPAPGNGTVGGIFAGANVSDLVAPPQFTVVDATGAQLRAVAVLFSDEPAEDVSMSWPEPMAHWIGVAAELRGAQ